MFNICLPVDVLIFFKEPLGPFGTLFATIWAVIPFLVMVGDATFPEKEIIVEDKSKDTLVPIVPKCYNVSSDYLISWTKHLSLTYNEKYKYCNKPRHYIPMVNYTIFTI